MSSNVQRDLVALVVLAETDIPLDAESLAVTYDTPVAEWRAALERLEAAGDVREVDEGLYQPTDAGRNRVLMRGSDRTRSAATPG